MFRFELKIYSDWTGSVGEVSELNLDLPLLTRSEESKLISVNFDPQVKRRELFLISFESSTSD